MTTTTKTKPYVNGSTSNGASQPPQQRKRVFKPLTLSEFRKRPPKQWLVDQIFGAGDLLMLYGASGSGKSFIVIDLIFAACLGETWAGRFAVARPLNVAYCAGEGLSGLPARFDAAARHFGVPDDMKGLTLYETVPDLWHAHMDDVDTMLTETIEAFVYEWQDRQRNEGAAALDLLVIDTLHTACDGADENTSRDMGRVLKLAKFAAKTLGCAVLLVHHANKANTGERGSGALRASMDTMIETEVVKGIRVMSCEKVKDGEAWKPQSYELIPLIDTTSAYVSWGDAGGKGDDDDRGTKRAVLDYLRANRGQRFTRVEIATAVKHDIKSVGNRIGELKEEELIDWVKDDGPVSKANPWKYFVPA